MKKTILNHITILIYITILMVSLATAFNPLENLENYLNLKYDDVTVVGDSVKYEIESNHTATDILKDGRDYTIFMSGDDYDSAVIVSYKNEVKIQQLEARVTILEDKLNITDVIIPKELYKCLTNNETVECPGGVSGGKRTRCYQENDYFWFQAEYCKDGWELIK